jgi:hypothetical protein
MPTAEYPAKVEKVINTTAIADFTPRDFLDLSLAALDQASLRSPAYNRAYAAVEALIAEQTPEAEEAST